MPPLEMSALASQAASLDTSVAVLVTVASASCRVLACLKQSGDAPWVSCVTYWAWLVSQV